MSEWRGVTLGEALTLQRGFDITKNEQRLGSVPVVSSSGVGSATMSVDVLGEGVDVPDVDTLLLLRPTQSPTVFSQQLGRGLRRSEGKGCLTVLDLIGQQHRSYRFDRRLAALVDRRNGPVRQQIEAGFPLLPAGCDVRLDRGSEAIVLANLKDAARLGRWPALVEDLEALGDVGMAEFLEQSSRELVDLDRGPDHSWTRLRRDAGLRTPGGDANEAGLLRAIGRMLHIDDAERVGFYQELLGAERPPREGDLDRRQLRLALMLHFDLWGVSQRRESFAASMAELWRERAVRAELVELLGLLDVSSEVITHPLGLEPEIPLLTHGRYSRDEALRALAVRRDHPVDRGAWRATTSVNCSRPTSRWTSSGRGASRPGRSSGCLRTGTAPFETPTRPPSRRSDE